jgi:hypothetical protein
MPPKGSFPLGRVAIEANYLHIPSVRSVRGLQTCAVVATCERSRAAFSVETVAARAQSQGWSPDCCSQLARNAPSVCSWLALGAALHTVNTRARPSVTTSVFIHLRCSPSDIVECLAVIACGTTWSTCPLLTLLVSCESTTESRNNQLAHSIACLFDVISSTFRSQCGSSTLRLGSFSSFFYLPFKVIYSFLS